MKYVFAILMLLLVIPQNTEAVSLKAGGGMLFDPTRWGGHLSLEIPLGSDHPTYLAPFVEFYQKSQVKEIPIGISLLYKAPLSELLGTIYFGVGGGVFLSRVTFTDQVLGTVKLSRTEPMISVTGGIRLDVSDRMGLYTQVYLLRPFETGSTTVFGVQAGLHFEIGEKD